MKKNITRINFLLFIFVFGSSLAIFSQTELKTLTEKDYGKWETLGGRSILTSDGRWMAYSVSNNNRDTEMRLADLTNNTSKVVKNAGTHTFSGDDKWLGYLISPDAKTLKALEKDKKPIIRKFEMINLATGETTKVENIASFLFSKDGKFLALKPNPDPKSESKTSTIIVRNLDTGMDTTFGNVKDYAWSDQGSLLAMIVDTKEVVGNGVTLFDGKFSAVLDSKEAVYNKLTWRRDSNDLAVFRSQKTEGFKDETNNILVWKNASISSAANNFDPVKTTEFPADMRILDKKPLSWSADGNAVFFSIDMREKSPAKPKKDEKEAPKEKENPKEKEDEDEPAAVEIWNSKDVLTIPEQKIGRAHV